jgi:hypothetical protein
MDFKQMNTRQVFRILAILFAAWLIARGVAGLMGYDLAAYLPW